MAFQLEGFGGVVAEVDGTTFRAARTTIRPVDHDSLGQYREAVTIGLVATQAANGTLLSLRWTDATRFLVLHLLKLKFQQTSATITAAILDQRFEVFVARSFTVSDSAGSSVLPTGNNAKKRTGGMGTTLIGDFRISAAAAGLTVGTRTLDTFPMMIAQHHMIAAAPTAQPYPVYENVLDMTGPQEHPIVLAQNEGIIVRGPTTVFGATGTANLLVELAWAEVPAY